ncbi:hypothetical protein BDA99DRAFT_575682 [Phascolomyces articulosus]|uniref:Uncharacterized protein n=1 Tax=Phascolomyces articulosus TaxID=60185 RepID=A0AAD5JQP5_9FUNG|nr:hypothetical protein BDA99DRAFT_575682 [Phascolomyces articulosus]
MDPTQQRHQRLLNLRLSIDLLVLLFTTFITIEEFALFVRTPELALFLINEIWPFVRFRIVCHNNDPVRLNRELHYLDLAVRNSTRIFRILNPESPGLARWLRVFSTTNQHHVEFRERTTSLHMLNFIEKAAEQQFPFHTLSFNRTIISTRHITRILSAFISLNVTRIDYNGPLNIQHVNIQFVPGGRQNVTLTHLSIFSFNTSLRNAGQFPLAMREFTDYVRDHFPNLNTFIFAPNHPFKTPEDTLYIQQQLPHIQNLHL